MPGLALALSGPRGAHPLPLVFARLRAAGGRAGEPGGAVASAQVPLELGGAPQQAGLALHRDPLAPFPSQVADAAEASGAVSGAHAAGHLWS